MSSVVQLGVSAAHPALAAAAQALAARLDLPLLPPATDPRHCDSCAALLLLGDDGLALQLTGPAAPGPVAVDFGAAAMRHRRAAGHNEMLGRAVGVTRKAGMCVLDATAGLGRDAFVLADLGTRVILCERNPVVAAMLEAGLAAARDSRDSWLSTVVASMQLHCGDARELPADLVAQADVIYLDPMFPERGKRAAVKKEMALFQLLLDDAAEEPALLEWARAQDVARVVVKRPLKAPALGGASPSHVLKGRAVRFDVYVQGSLA
ncbi:SAM-dependent methyltransferase [Mangrovimicrobium sediminis]|uniref:Ribosomal RNA small subunit methyltransferase J n=1 Tax=Mangrovimicrobium sediminis TaxID=2562682 RepID=A0A4Z0LXR7_9GAMM|nr:class I SAM-dependent methyltransferase [Haliea sp. SAOS-164]TGD72081.1 SAM-dependent methyltransferase [Haliea sp. SAOS-164]